MDLFIISEAIDIIKEIGLEEFLGDDSGILKSFRGHS